MATHECTACLSETIQGATTLELPLVLATSICSGPSGGNHSWVRKAPVPSISIKDRVGQHKSPNLQHALNTPLQFKIPVTKKQYVDLYPEIFELGNCEYDVYVDAWLAYLTTGQSEYTVVGVDSLWLVIIHACCAGIIFYRDEKDKSSK
eukprot:gene18731-26495_t